MAAKDLVMLDEVDEEERDNKIVVVFSDNCVMNGATLAIPLNEALAIAANINIQAASMV